MQTIRFIFIFLFIFIFAQTANVSAHVVSGPTSHSVQGFLNSIQTMSASFVQLDETGKEQSGVMMIKKPGLVKWQYIKPKSALIIGDGKHFVYYDQELDEVSYLDSEFHFALFFASSSINLKNVKHTIAKFDDNVDLILPDMEELGDGMTLIVHMQHSKPEELELVGFSILEEGQSVMKVTFHEQLYNIPIKKQEFEFKNPKFFKFNDAK